LLSLWNRSEKGRIGKGRDGLAKKENKDLRGTYECPLILAKVVHNKAQGIRHKQHKWGK